MANPMHAIDFEAVLNAKIDQKDWEKKKKQLNEMFGNLKIGLDEGMAEAEAQAVLDLFNRKFAEAELPIHIDMDFLKKEMATVERYIARTLANLNDIDTSAIKGIGDELKRISDNVDTIANKINKNVQKSTQSAIANVNKLDAALSKIGDSYKDVESALEFSNTGAVKKRLDVLADLETQYKALADAKLAAEKAGEVEDVSDWVKRQQAMVKYVKAYEDHYAKLDVEKQKALRESSQGKLYNVLKPRSQDAKTNLQNLLDRRAGTYSEHNGPWAKEETLKEVQEILKKGIKVKSDESKPAKTTPDKLPVKSNAKDDGITVYRAIYRPEEGEERSRKEVMESWGGSEIWTSKKEVAETYADGQEEPVILKGKIVAEKPFVIDAGGKNWNNFRSMNVVESDGNKTALPDKFPELFKRIDSGELSDDADIQSELNKLIKQLGHDVLETRNVVDTNNPESYKELSTTFSVLKDSALKVESAFAMIEQDRQGITTFDNKAKKENIPDYYEPPSADESSRKPKPSKVDTPSSGASNNEELVNALKMALSDLKPDGGEASGLADKAGEKIAQEATLAQIRDSLTNDNGDIPKVEDASSNKPANSTPNSTINTTAQQVDIDTPNTVNINNPTSVDLSNATINLPENIQQNDSADDVELQEQTGSLTTSFKTLSETIGRINGKLVEIEPKINIDDKQPDDTANNTKLVEAVKAALVELLKTSWFPIWIILPRSRAGGSAPTRMFIPPILLPLPIRASLPCPLPASRRLPRQPSIIATIPWLL